MQTRDKFSYVEKNDGLLQLASASPLSQDRVDYDRTGSRDGEHPGQAAWRRLMRSEEVVVTRFLFVLL